MSEDIKEDIKITDPKELLKLTRRTVAPYLKTISKHQRAIKPRVAVSNAWINYYKTLESIRPLTTKEQSKLSERQKSFDLANARLDVYRAAGKYARSRNAVNLVNLRKAQHQLHEARIETLPPEKQKKEREKLIPEKTSYDALKDIQQDIGDKCKSLKGAKTPKIYESTVSRVERINKISDISKELQQHFKDAYEVSHPEKFPDALSNYLALKGNSQ